MTLVRFLACEDLILHKLLAGCLLDRADAAMLLRANRTDLNLEYLLGWTTTLSLRAELAEVWEEAFPGEAMPETSGKQIVERATMASARLGVVCESTGVFGRFCGPVIRLDLFGSARLGVCRTRLWLQ